MSRHINLQILSILILLSSIGLITACGVKESETSLPEIKTELLVKPPEAPLPLNKPIGIKSRTVARDGVSLVELWAVLVPSGNGSNILIHSDAAPYQQTSFIALQIFRPVQEGHYVLKVIGYNNKGQSFVSDSISFDVIK